MLLRSVFFPGDNSNVLNGNHIAKFFSQEQGGMNGK